MDQTGAYDRVVALQTERSDCRVVIRFDTNRGEVERFTVQLQHTKRFFNPRWLTIAQFDHDPSAPNGHDIYEEGLHIDIYRRSGGDLKVFPRQLEPPGSGGAVIRFCSDYLKTHYRYFLKVHRDEIHPNDPPPWP